MEITERLMQAVGVSVRVEEELIARGNSFERKRTCLYILFNGGNDKQGGRFGLDNDTARLLCTAELVEALQIYWHFLKMIQKICVSE